MCALKDYHIKNSQLSKLKRSLLVLSNPMIFSTLYHQNQIHIHQVQAVVRCGCFGSKSAIKLSPKCNPKKQQDSVVESESTDTNSGISSLEDRTSSTKTPEADSSDETNTVTYDIRCSRKA